jgi:hypothetical protein
MPQSVLRIRITLSLRCDADPHPIFHFYVDANPDPTFHVNADLDTDLGPSFQIKAQKLGSAQK